jgi:apolipoprotein D and lipocalin family protein
MVLKPSAILAFAFALFPALNSTSAAPKFPPVTGFDLSKYLGKWYEIARFPAWFEKDLVNVTATYSLRSDGKVKVLNEGYKKSKDGKHSVAVGKAKLASSPDTGYLKVSFFGPFYADYIILDLDKENYQYALVASSYEYLWILSREPKMDPDVYGRLVEKAKSLGFNMEKLYVVPQNW